MLSWLRRTIGRFDRRWIRDPGERDRHDTQVRQRLQEPMGGDSGSPSSEAADPADPGRSGDSPRAEDRPPS